MLMKLTPAIDVDNGDHRKTSIWLAYSTTDVVVIEDVLLFDFAGIVSAVGGSLGLFIGFSFLDLFKALISKMTSRF